MRTNFDEQLWELDQEMTAMGGLCETAIAVGARSLLRNELEPLKELPELDNEIQRQEHQIESLCLQLLLQQQPVAGDLRTISAALKMITDMERIGHQAADMGDIIARGRITLAHGKFCLKDMALEAAGMVTASIDAFVSRDLVGARDVISRDDKIDRYFEEIKRGLVSYLASPGADGESVIDLLMVTKYLERIGDHAVNIAEWAIFSLTGVHHSGDAD